MEEVGPTDGDSYTRVFASPSPWMKGLTFECMPVLLRGAGAAASAEMRHGHGRGECARRHAPRGVVPSRSVAGPFNRLN